MLRDQHNVVSTDQLKAIGFTRNEIKNRVRRGEWVSVARGVVLIGLPSVAGRGHLYAAQLRAGGRSFLSAGTALSAHGLRPVARSHLEVTIVGAARQRPGLRIHRLGEEPHRSEIVERSGLRYSSVPRALVELATRRRPVDEIEATLLQAVRRNLLDVSALHDTIERHAGEPGIPIVRAVAARYTDPADRCSQLEHSFDAHAAMDPRIPPYRKNVRMGRYELDCVFDDQRVVVELDGRNYHRAVQDMERDRAKDAYLQIKGLSVIRITDFRWEHDRAGAIDDLLALLGRSTERRAA